MSTPGFCFNISILLSSINTMDSVSNVHFPVLFQFYLVLLIPDHPAFRFRVYPISILLSSINTLLAIRLSA